VARAALLRVVGDDNAAVLLPHDGAITTRQASTTTLPVRLTRITTVYTAVKIPPVVAGSLLANGGTARLPNGDFDFDNGNEMVVATPSGSVVASRIFPTQPGPCGAPSIPLPAPGQTMPSVTDFCPPESPLALAIDPSGNIWIVVQGGHGETS
jgi:hypothetical protein